MLSESDNLRTLVGPLRVSNASVDAGAFDWQPLNICFHRAFREDLCFQVHGTTINDVMHIKPIVPVLHGEFEQLFGFGMGCFGFDVNRIVRIHDFAECRYERRHGDSHS